MRVKNNKITSYKKIILMAIVTLFLTVVILSVYYTALEIHHECLSDECPICEQIQQCENTIRQIESGVITFVSLIIPLLIFIHLFSQNTFVILQNSLITKKVRLNN